MKISWNDIVRKLTSRKFLVAVAGIVTGIALAMGADANDIETISGIVLTMIMGGSYIFAEGLVDAKNKEEIIEVIEVADDEEVTE